MLRRKRQTEELPDWFIKDQAISREADDRLDHRSVAVTLVAAVRSSATPCMIGLMGEFGRGKSSTTNIAAEMLEESSAFDAISVVADKHAGHERARNLVHAAAAEVEQLVGRSSTDEIETILRPLRESGQTTVLNPTDTAAARLASGRYKPRGLLVSLWPAWLLLAVAMVYFAASGNWNGLVATVIPPAVIFAFVWVLMTKEGSPVADLVKPGTETDIRPRAEAADEIEVVFGQLVDYHKKKRNRRLVVFIDDIDRLSSDDLLDALRSLRSLQSVPRGEEPIFVVSCNENILRAAVAVAESTPAAEVVAHPGGVRSGGSDHDHPALAFIDKLLTVRVQMPPSLPGDMRRFALETVDQGHPLRAEPGLDVEAVIGILIHDNIDSPRSVIRILNRFIAAFLLGKEREAGDHLYRNDVTHHTDVLAQLTVLLDEFPSFHAEIVRNQTILPAAQKVALQRTDLAPSEIDALDSSEEFVRDETGADASFEFQSPSLRKYLSSTARRVDYPVDLTPLIYFSHSPGGRVLGAQLRSELLGAVHSGDAEAMAQAVNSVPTDQLGAAAGEIIDALNNAAVSDTTTYLASVAPNLADFGKHASDLAEAAADLIGRAPNVAIEPEVLTHILSEATPSRDAVLTDRLVRYDEDDEVTNRRMSHAAMFAAQAPRIRDSVLEHVSVWVNSIPERGSWELGQVWLDVAEDFRGRADTLELAEIITGAALASVRGEAGFSDSDLERLSTLVTQSETLRNAPASQALASPGANTRSLFIRTWEYLDNTGNVSDVLFLSKALADWEVSVEDRATAVGLLAAWGAEWAGETTEVEAGVEVDVEQEVLAALGVALENDHLTLAVTGVLKELSRQLEADVFPLLQAAVNHVMAVARPGASELKQVGDLVAALDSAGEAAWSALLPQVLAPIGEDTDPSSPKVILSLSVVQAAATSDLAKHALVEVVRKSVAAINAAGVHSDLVHLDFLTKTHSFNPEFLAEHAPTVLQHAVAYVVNKNEAANRLRVLTLFPWPDDHVAEALSAIDVNWGQLPEDLVADVFGLVTRAAGDNATLGRFHDRIVAASKEGASTRAAERGAVELPRMTELQASEFLGNTVGSLPGADQFWIAATLDLAAATIVRYPGDEAAVRRLIEAADESSKADRAYAALQKLSSDHLLSQGVANILALDADESALAELANEVFQAIDEGIAPTPGATTLIAIAGAGVALDDVRVRETVAHCLEGADVALAKLLKRLHTASGLSSTRGPVEDVLKRLRKDKEREAVAGAFDAQR